MTFTVPECTEDWNDALHTLVNVRSYSYLFYNLPSIVLTLVVLMFNLQRTHTSVLQAMMRIIPFLTFGDEENMRTLVNHFLPYLDFEK